MHPTKKTIDLINEAIYIFLLGLGALAGYFISPVLLEKPHLAWIVLFVIVLLRLFNGLIPENILEKLKAFTYGIAVIGVIIIFVLSTGGKTVIFGSIPESDFTGFTSLLSVLVIIYLWALAFLEFTIGLLNNRRHLNHDKISYSFLFLAIVSFAIMIINIGGILPWFKAYDIYLFLGSIIFAKIAFTMPKAK